MRFTAHPLRIFRFAPVSMLSLLLILLLSYLLGSIPTALLVGKARGVDLRQHGSGSVGATNALRVLGKGPGGFVFAADLLKGLLATRGVSLLRVGDGLPSWLGPDAAVWVMVLAGAAAMLGHVYTAAGRLFYGSWRGGKGVATGVGMLLGLAPVAILLAFGLWVLIVWWTRYVSLGSILGALSLPVTAGVQRALGHDVAFPVLLFVIVVPLFILYTHRANVRRLLNGTESRVRSFKPAVGMRGRGEI